MKKDIGFFDINGNYIEDIQEVDEMEMDKEIIIDGVGCVFYNNGKCENPNGMSCNCINNAVCYYKELKRLEKENAELKAENERLKEATDGLLKIQYTLADSCKKYSETLQEIKAIAGFHITDADSEDIQNDMKQILDLITKAEEE